MGKRIVTTVIDKWGNSLGVRLPNGIVEAVGLHAGDRVVIEVVRGSIVISHSRPHYDLQDLLVGMSPENVHPEFAIDDPSHRTDHPPSEGTPI